MSISCSLARMGPLGRGASRTAVVIVRGGWCGPHRAATPNRRPAGVRRRGRTPYPGTGWCVGKWGVRPMRHRPTAPRWAGDRSDRPTTQVAGLIAAAAVGTATLRSGGAARRRGPGHALRPHPVPTPGGSMDPDPVRPARPRARRRRRQPHLDQLDRAPCDAFDVRACSSTWSVAPPPSRPPTAPGAHRSRPVRPARRLRPGPPGPRRRGARDGALDRTVAAFGDLPGDTFARFCRARRPVHGWDMATATGQPWRPARRARGRGRRLRLGHDRPAARRRDLRRRGRAARRRHAHRAVGRLHRPPPTLEGQVTGADLELHPVDVAEEQGPGVAAEVLDLADLGAGDLESGLHLLEGGSVGDGDAEVVDGAPAAEAPALADDRLLRTSRRR